jgi:hypothetical protein
MNESLLIPERPSGPRIDDLGPTPIRVSPGGALLTAVGAFPWPHPHPGPAPADLLDQGPMR